MSRVTLLVLCSCVALAACSRNKSSASDTTAAAAAQAATPAGTPATQSLAQLAGTWRGSTLAKDRDSTLQTWTFSTSGDTGTVTFADGTKLAVHDIRVAGDSILSKIGPTKSIDPAQKGVLVSADVVSRVHGDTLVGVVVTRLAAKPDSIVSEGRIVGTRVKP